MSVVWEVSFSTRRLPWSSAHSPCVCLALADRIDAPLRVGRAVRLSLLGFSKDRLSIGIPTGVLSPPRSAVRLRARLSATFGAVLPWRFRASRSPSDLAVFTTSPVYSSVSCRSVAPGPDPEVRPVSLGVGSRLPFVPRAAFLPFEAFFLAESHRHRSRAACGGPSPPCRCRHAVHRPPCLLVLGRFPFRNLEAFLPRRSGAHVRGFPHRRALAPLGLSLPPLTLP